MNCRDRRAIRGDEQGVNRADLHRYPRPPGVKAADVAGAHAADVAVQGAYGVDYKQHFVDEEAGKVFCIVNAPDREKATQVHREAHVLEAHTLHLVTQD